MAELTPANPPDVLPKMLSATLEIGFQMLSDPLTGSLLRTLAVSKPAGTFLELGTGTGLATAWLLSGMDDHSLLMTVENDPAVAAVAQKYLGHDPRLSIHIEDAEQFLARLDQRPLLFDFIFADTWAGKYTHLEATLAALKVGGLYIIDDMLPQATWPPGHETKVAALIADLECRQDLQLTKLNWASGIIIAAKVALPRH